MKLDLMKRVTNNLIAIVALTLLGTGMASAQSLGDYARSVRKDKPKPDAATRHFDNDNLPTNETLSVVGPDPSAQTAATGGQPGAKTGAPAVDPKEAEQERKQAAADLQDKLDSQKQKIESLNHELDLEQREYRLRAASFYGDAGAQLRNSAQWSKEDAQYKSDTDAKQKAIADAQQKLTDLQEEARHAGLEEKDAGRTSDRPKDEAKDQDKDQQKDDKDDKDQPKDEDKDK